MYVIIFCITSNRRCADHVTGGLLVRLVRRLSDVIDVASRARDGVRQAQAGAVRSDVAGARAHHVSVVVVRHRMWLDVSATSLFILLPVKLCSYMYNMRRLWPLTRHVRLSCVEVG